MWVDFSWDELLKTLYPTLEREKYIKRRRRRSHVVLATRRENPVPENAMDAQSCNFSRFRPRRGWLCEYQGCINTS